MHHGHLALIDLTGVTQLRLRFWRDDDNDGQADYISIYSGNSPPVSTT